MHLDAQFWTALLQIIGINIVLSGDNAVVIAMACRSLPPERQKWGIFLGAAAAIVLRIFFTVFIVYLLQIPYLKIAGGLLLFWIGYQLMTDHGEEDEVKAATSLWSAVRIVLVADAVMSLDNVIAVAAAAQGSLTLLILGLLISVPLVIYGATILIKLLNRYPIIVPAGAALIGYVAGEVIVDDPTVKAWVGHNAEWLHWGAPLLGALLVVLVGRVIAPHSLKPAPALTADGVAASGAALGVRAGLQIFGRLVAANAPLLIGFFASAFGYTLATEPHSNEPMLDTAIDIMDAIRPILAAILAVAVGELVAWTVRKARSDAHAV